MDFHGGAPASPVADQLLHDISVRPGQAKQAFLAVRDSRPSATAARPLAFPPE